MGRRPQPDNPRLPGASLRALHRGCNLSLGEGDKPRHPRRSAPPALTAPLDCDRCCHGHRRARVAVGASSHRGTGLDLRTTMPTPRSTAGWPRTLPEDRPASAGSSARLAGDQLDVVDGASGHAARMGGDEGTGCTASRWMVRAIAMSRVGSLVRPPLVRGRRTKPHSPVRALRTSLWPSMAWPPSASKKQRTASTRTLRPGPSCRPAARSRGATSSPTTAPSPSIGLNYRKTDRSVTVMIGLRARGGLDNVRLIRACGRPGSKLLLRDRVEVECSPSDGAGTGGGTRGFCSGLQFVHLGPSERDVVDRIVALALSQ